MQIHNKTLFKLWSWCGRILYIVVWPGLFLMINNSKRSRVVVTFNDEVLLVKDWLGNGDWKLPGGGIHNNESPVLSATRELQEETSIKTDPKSIVSLGNIESNGHGINTTLYCYSLELATKPTVKNQKFEILDINWFDTNADNLNDIITDNTAKVLALWRKR